MSTLAQTIRQIRKRRGETMSRFGERLGCAASVVSRYEADLIRPSRSMLMLLLSLSEDDERPPLLEALGLDGSHIAGLNDAEVQHAFTQFEEYLSAAGKAGNKPKDRELMVRFAGAVNAILGTPEVPIHSAIVEILEHWLHWRDTRSTHELFANAALYLEVELKPRELLGSSPTRRPTKKRNLR